jgi:hypothetical protein
MLHAYVQRFDAMERECKNLEFGRHLNQALVHFSVTRSARQDIPALCRFASATEVFYSPFHVARGRKLRLSAARFLQDANSGTGAAAPSARRALSQRSPLFLAQ